ncbi:MAG: hypothetical protein FWB91_07255 [Defluviitaleaceae bacterium]|nr:hypothetical protein [Defluviitaleaceae bacterium]
MITAFYNYRQNGARGVDIVFAIVFIINVVSIIIMVCEIKEQHAKNNGFYDKNVKYSVNELKAHRETMRVLIFIGAAGGILLWGCIIGLILSLYSMDFQRLLNSLYVSKTLAFLPSTLGTLHIYQKRKTSNHAR